MKVSIIIPIYKTAEFLSRCLDSCINQTYRNLEIIAVIDGSPDNSLEIALKYQAKDQRIKVINKLNEGLPKARRTGFLNSSGDYIFHLDSDDYINYDTIECLIENAQKNNADIVICNTIYENKDGEYITSWHNKAHGQQQSDYLKDIFTSSIQPNIWGRLIKRKIFEVADVPGEFSCGEDFLANVMMICYNPGIRISLESKFLHHYVVYPESLTNTWPAEVFMPYTEKLSEILIDTKLEGKIFADWSYFRIKTVWLYYLRRGGNKYLRDKNFVKSFYEKYYNVVKRRLSISERFELTLYRINQPIARIYSKIYLKVAKTLCDR